MKTIYFVRHAKSSWNEPVTDKERGLNDRGYSDAKLIAEALQKEDLAIEKVFSSTAKRAEITCSILTHTLEIPEEIIEYTDDLYDFDGRGVLKFIKKLPDDLDKVALFGHNPAFTGVVNVFGNLQLKNLPTCGVVGVQFNINSWAEFAQGETILKLVPKDFK